MNTVYALAISALALSAVPAVAAPILPPTIQVGASVSGSFAYNFADASADDDSSTSSGWYRFTAAGSSLSLAVAGFTFTAPPTSDNLLIRVSDSSLPGNADFLQISTVGDASTFPFLHFSRQNPALEPEGGHLLNFRFPNTALASDSLPTLIDASATQPHPSDLFTSGIYGQVEGISKQSVNRGIREWAIFYQIEPADMAISLSDAGLSGVFKGVVVGVVPGEDALPPVSVPEPATTSLALVALLCGLRAKLKRLRTPSI